MDTSIVEEGNPDQSEAATMPEAEDLRKTRQARWFSISMFIAAVVIFILLLDDFYFFQGLYYVELLLLLSIMFGLYYFKGALTLESLKGSPLSSGMWPMIVACFTTWIFGNAGAILDYPALWMVVIPVFLGLLLLFIASIRAIPLEQTKRVIYILLYSVMLLGASYGIVAFTNVRLDHSTPSSYQSTITEKHSKTKSTTYSVKISGWGENEFTHRIEVSQAFYDEVQVGQKVRVDVYPGKLHIPWFQLVRE
ncbi:MAG: hypothetical protein JO154_25515 [Chitinophaga sp.]|uniref:hypothetical protein n=1 Tax=Chitinophaga sp. TaxID=1869181 RepID=UPI0025B939FB|nr:hypothetical protein [Chitinophaga sp.]MBV8255979.1 hypothetical protein [Chitinophaga sp.]